MFEDNKLDMYSILDEDNYRVNNPFTRKRFIPRRFLPEVFGQAQSYIDDIHALAKLFYDFHNKIVNKWNNLLDQFSDIIQLIQDQWSDFQKLITDKITELTDRIIAAEDKRITVNLNSLKTSTTLATGTENNFAIIDIPLDVDDFGTKVNGVDSDGNIQFFINPLGDMNADTSAVKYDDTGRFNYIVTLTIFKETLPLVQTVLDGQGNPIKDERLLITDNTVRIISMGHFFGSNNTFAIVQGKMTIQNITANSIPSGTIYTLGAFDVVQALFPSAPPVKILPAYLRTTKNGPWSAAATAGVDVFTTSGGLHRGYVLTLLPQITLTPNQSVDIAINGTLILNSDDLS